MQVVIHLNKQKLEGLNQQLMSLNEMYIKKDYHLDKALLQLLDDVQIFYGQIGDSTLEGKISQLKIYFNTALFGINPKDLEKIKIGKRDNIRISAFHCLSKLGEYLEMSILPLIHLIEESSNTVSQVILSAIQSKLLNEGIIKESNNIQRCTKLWQFMKQNEQINLIDKQLKLKIHEQDIYIILDQKISRLSPEINYE